MSDPINMPLAIDVACRKAEKAIQKILIDLANDVRKDIDFVRIDTRNFANLAVEIFLKGDPHA